MPLPRALATARNGIWSITVLLRTGPLWVSLGLFHTTRFTPDFLITLWKEGARARTGRGIHHRIREGFRPFVYQIQPTIQVINIGKTKDNPVKENTAYWHCYSNVASEVCLRDNVVITHDIDKT